MSTTGLLENVASTTFEFNRLVSSLVKNSQYDMLVWILRHFKFWTKKELIIPMRGENTTLVTILTSIMHMTLRGMN